MITSQNLIDQITTYNPKSDLDLIQQAACDYSKLMHTGQTRQSNLPYYTHPLEVALIMAAQHMDDSTIITALLHDVLEDTNAGFNDIAKRFGTEIAHLVEGVTKLTNLDLSHVPLNPTPPKQTEAEERRKMLQAENLKKFLLASSKDLRVLLVKLGDRLHNMRTISFMSADKQTRKAQETMDIFAPLAGRMGMQNMREELEDLSFGVLNPKARTSIMRRFIKLKNQRGLSVPKTTKDIKEVLTTAGITAEIYGREKRPYSIWHKMRQKDGVFERLSDIYGFRIIATDEADIYPILGAIHKRWRAVPGRFKDYISQPKPNGYRSLHTTVSGRDGRIVEIQIRTEDMHRIAEYGVAAHWSYRDGKQSTGGDAPDPLSWFAAVKENIENIEDHEDFVENVKLEMFTNQIFCFTPKGEVVNLAKGATVIDFAYAIHSRLGNQFISALVDGKDAPRSLRLRNGQSVEITTAHGQYPDESWIKHANTSHAHREIRRALAVQKRKGYFIAGRTDLDLAFKRIQKRLTLKNIDVVIRKLNLKNREALFTDIGNPNAQLKPEDVIQMLYPELAQNPSLKKAGNKTPNHGQTSSIVIGLELGQVPKSAPCCQPLPGERIIGIATQNTETNTDTNTEPQTQTDTKAKTSEKKTVLIHRIDCKTLVELEGEDWIDLHWSGNHAITDNRVVLELTVAHDAGVLGRICTLIGENKSNITDLVFTEKRVDFYRLEVCLTLRDVEHLYHIIGGLELDPDISRIVQKKRFAKLI